MSKDQTISARLPSDLVAAVDELRRALAQTNRYPVMSRSQVVEMVLGWWVEENLPELEDTVARKIAARIGVL